MGGVNSFLFTYQNIAAGAARPPILDSELRIRRRKAQVVNVLQLLQVEQFPDGPSQYRLRTCSMNGIQMIKNN